MKNKQPSKKSKIQEVKEFIILIIVAFTIKTCLIEIYVVPTGSMEKTILVGDMLIGNKFIYGMRTPDWIGIPYTRMGFYIPSFRLPKFKNVEVGDVVIFEFPRDPFQKYVKRCVGLPGDKVEIKDGVVFNNLKRLNFPSEGQFLPKSSNSEINVHSQFYSKPISTFPLSDEPYIVGEIDQRQLYPLFSSELFYDESNINGIYDQGEPFIDRNGNDKWDHGNEDNISEFIVPYKNQIINVNESTNWKHILNLLLLDGCEIYFKKNNIKYTLHVESSFERARLSGIVKNEIIKIFYMFTGQKDKISDLTISNRNNIKEKWTDLEIERFKLNKINPWELTLIFNDNSPLLVFFKSLSEPSLNVFDFAADPIFSNDVSVHERTQIIDQVNDLIVKFDPYSDLYINGIAVDKNFTYKLKHNYYFLIGDNRNRSSDCRFWGFVPDYHILGTPVYALINVHNPIKNIRFEAIN